MAKKSWFGEFFRDLLAWNAGSIGTTRKRKPARKPARSKRARATTKGQAWTAADKQMRDDLKSALHNQGYRGVQLNMRVKRGMQVAGLGLSAALREALK